jgi:hypothetical protein
MGHGFYQISPELFFRVMSPENGFILRKLVIFDASKKDAPFFQVHDPAASGHRTDLRSSKPMYLAALAQRVASTPILQKPPQQSDYVTIWDKHRKSQAAKSGSVPNRLTRLRLALNPYWPVWLLRWKNNLLLSWRRGSSKLSNKDNFRRLSYAEICRERGEAMKEMSPGQGPAAA